MIEINLLPQDVPGKGMGAAAARTGGGGGGGVLVALVMLFAFLAVVVSAGFVINEKRKADNALAEKKTQESELTKKRDSLRKEHAQLQADLETLRNQVAVLEVLDPKDRLYWAKKMNILPMFVPDGVFLESFVMVESVREQETEESRRAYNEWKKKNLKTGAPKRVMVPVISSSLRLNGIAYVADGTSDQRLELILDFWNALAEKKVTVPYSGDEVGFLEHMTPIINSDEINTAKVQGREVSKFSFYMNSIPITANPKNATAAK